jgi:hypothetical protein
MTCKFCKERGKTWEGDNPECYLDNPEGNWNCAMLSAIRKICYRKLEGVAHLWYDDMNSVLINISNVNYNEEFLGYSLFIQWYKSRGHVDKLLIMSDGEPRKPTEEELSAIINYYSKSK